jgi:hypothetical protein
MNLSIINNKVAEFAPDANDIHCVDVGNGVWDCVATVEGKARSVQFDRAGLYGVPQPGLWSMAPKSEIWIASQIAQELRK